MNLRRIIIIALFAALIVAGAYIAVPVGPVPITLQTVFVLLAGILGGKGIGAASIAVYLTLGAIGLPVFSGGIGGFAHFVSPTGGFLISWLIEAPLAGAITDVGFRNNLDSDKTTVKQLVFVIIGTLTGTLIMYVIGIPYLKAVLQVTWKNAFILGLVPFIPGDLVKMVAVILLGNIFAIRVRQFLHIGNGELIKGKDENS